MVLEAARPEGPETWNELLNLWLALPPEGAKCCNVIAALMFSSDDEGIAPSRLVEMADGADAVSAELSLKY